MANEQNPWLATRNRTGDAYDENYERRAAAGEDVHGEANFIGHYDVRSVLDGGCGTGRVARELARRGVDVVGVDLDPVMLETAIRKGPDIEWHCSDLAEIALDRQFDAVVLAGNVMIFVTPGTEANVLRNLARHLNPRGLLIAGFQLRPGGLSVQKYDELAAASGFELFEGFATWDRGTWTEGGDYAVSVHRLV